MPVVQYLVTVEAGHDSGVRLTAAEFDDRVSDVLADAVLDAVDTIRTHNDDPTRYRVEQTTVEPCGVDNAALPLSIDDWRSLHAALEIVVPPGSDSDQAVLRARIAILLSELDRERTEPHSASQRPELSIVPGGAE